MSDRTITPPQGAQRPKTGRRGGHSLRQIVGEYVGQPAGDAAQAVRRTGLRPGLDRSFGCEAELIGLVVEQDPTAGSELARNGMVTLYVAAPGDSPTSDEADPAETATERSSPAPIAPVETEVEVEAQSTPARQRRRRKPGLAERGPQVFDSPPAPVLPDTEHAVKAPAVSVAQTDAGQSWDTPSDTYESISEDLDEGVLDERDEAELSHDEFVVHLDDVLAGRTAGPRAWRRVYPRRSATGTLTENWRPRTWLGGHRRLVKVAGAVLAVWVLIGLAAPLDGHHGHSRTPGIASRDHLRSVAPATGARRRERRLSAKTPGPVARSRRRHTYPTHIRRRRRGWAPALPKAAAERREGASAQARPPQIPVPVARANAPSPPPVQEHTDGGLFSP